MGSKGLSVHSAEGVLVHNELTFAQIHACVSRPLPRCFSIN